MDRRRARRFADLVSLTPRHAWFSSTAVFRLYCQQRAGLPAGLSLLLDKRRPSTPGRELVETALEALSRDRDQPFAALNAASFTDGFVLEAAPGVVLDQPIEIVHLASGEASGFAAHPQPRSAGRRTAASRLIETFAGEGRYWRNDVIAVRLAAGAALDRVALVEEADDALHFAVLDAALGPAARLDEL